MEASVDPIPECRRCRELEQVIARLEARVRELEEKLAAALRQGKRQAAPFRREGGPKPHPQPPGRKSGDAHGPHAHRAIPAAQDVSETIDVPLPKRCTHCQSIDIQPRTEVEQQYQTEIPRTPIVRRFAIHLGTCRNCGRTVRGRHPLQTSRAVGAAGQQLGPKAHAALTLLNKEMGLAHGKVTKVFAQLLGIRIRYRHPENRALARFLWKHVTAWFRFLLDPAVSASNAAAERALRPAVVNRKVWGGNRTWPGAHRQGLLLTVLRTLHQRGVDAMHFLAQARSSPTPLPLPALPAGP